MFDVAYPRPLWLYVFKQDGCPACAEAEPHLRRLKATYPVRIMIVERYLNRMEWDGLGWVPRATPGYALVDRDGAEARIVKKRVDMMTFEELVKWIGEENLS